MKMKAKKSSWIKILIIFLAGVALIALLMIVGILPVPRLFGEDDSQVKKTVKVINNYNVEILTYGEDCHLPSGVLETKIDSIKSINYESYTETNPVLVINDNEDSIQLTSEEIAYIRSLIYEKKMSVIYLGEKYLGTWYDDYYDDKSGDKGIDFVCMNGSVVPITGFWGKTEIGFYKEDNSFMGKCIVWEIENGYVKYSN